MIDNYKIGLTSLLKMTEECQSDFLSGTGGHKYVCPSLL